MKNAALVLILTLISQFGYAFQKQCRQISPEASNTFVLNVTSSGTVVHIPRKITGASWDMGQLSKGKYNKPGLPYTFYARTDSTDPVSIPVAVAFLGVRLTDGKDGRLVLEKNGGVVSAWQCTDR